MLWMTLAGLALAISAIASGQVIEGASLGILFQPGALLIVAGGTFGAVVAQSTPRDFGTAVSLLGWLVRPPSGREEDTVGEIVKWARMAQKKGALELDALAANSRDSLLKNGLEMVVDNYGANQIRETLMTGVKVRDARLRNAVKVWESAGGYAPTIGILGSVLGLLHVMGALTDPSKLGPGIAMAFVATLYGLGLANMVLLPLASKFKAMLFELTLRDEMRVEGLAMIAETKKPHVIERSLKAFAQQGGNAVESPRLRRVA